MSIVDCSADGTILFNGSASEEKWDIVAPECEEGGLPILTQYDHLTVEDGIFSTDMTKKWNRIVLNICHYKLSNSIHYSLSYRAIAYRIKKCPKCAEMVKREALICRFCRYEFPPDALEAPEIDDPQARREQALREKGLR